MGAVSQELDLPVDNERVTDGALETRGLFAGGNLLLVVFAPAVVGPSRRVVPRSD